MHVRFSVVVVPEYEGKEVWRADESGAYVYEGSVDG